MSIREFLNRNKEKYKRAQDIEVIGVECNLSFYAAAFYYGEYKIKRVQSENPLKIEIK